MKAVGAAFLGRNMTAISASSAALAILQQDSTQIQGTCAADKILSLAFGLSDTVVGEAAKAKAAREAKLAEQKERITALDEAPREAGGSVSSEISAGTISSMGRIAAGTTLAQATGDWEATAAKAENMVTVFANTISDYNGKFHLLEIPTEEEFFKSVEGERLAKIAKGADAKTANAVAEKWNTQDAYQFRTRALSAVNGGLVFNSEKSELRITNGQSRIQGAFGMQYDITYDDKGQAQIGAFDIANSAGQKILSYGVDGSLTTYNEDGSIRRQMSHRDVMLAF